MLDLANFIWPVIYDRKLDIFLTRFSKLVTHKVSRKKEKLHLKTNKMVADHNNIPVLILLSDFSMFTVIPIP